MKEMELYLHIPFCVQKCKYCDFLSGPATPQQIDSYVEALCAEILCYREGFEERRISSIFLGGGTPSLLSGKQMLQIMKELYQTFNIEENAEITVEMNPSTVNLEKLRAYQEAGINRLSIGLQSTVDEELRLLGRIHDYKTFLEGYQMARDCGFDNINIDLISAIPGQTPKSWRRTLRRTAQLEPEHISAYSLIIEEGTAFYEMYGGEAADKQICPLPSEDEEREMYWDTKRILEEYAYHRYEISNYAKKGYECRHNLGYWERKDYLGLGTGAASLIDNRRYGHIRDREEYCARSANPETLQVDEEILSTKEQMEEFMFLGLRKTAGIQSKSFRACFGCDVEEVYAAVLSKLEREGLLLRDGEGFHLSERGCDISNYVFSEFLLD